MKEFVEKSEVKRLSEAKNKMSIIERIRSRIGESALYGEKAVCDSPCRFISLTKTRQALRLAFGTICAQIVTANSTKNTTGKGKIMKNTLRGIETCGQFSMIAGITRVTIKIANTFGGMLNVPTRQASLNSTLWGTLTPKNVNVMANLLKNVQRAAGNTARIITATNNKESSLRATSEDKGSANSYKEIFELFAALTYKKNRIGKSLIVQSCAERAMTIKAKIITATNNKESSYGQTIGSRLNQIAEITRSSRVMTNYIKKAIFRAKENTINNKESSYGLTIGSRLNQIAEITRSSRVMTNYIKHAEITRSSRVMTSYIKHAEITRSSRVMTNYIMNVTFNGGYHA